MKTILFSELMPGHQEAYKELKAKGIEAAWMKGIVMDLGSYIPE